MISNTKPNRTQKRVIPMVRSHKPTCIALNSETPSLSSATKPIFPARCIHKQILLLPKNSSNLQAQVENRQVLVATIDKPFVSL